MTDDALSSFVDAYRAEHSGGSLDRRALRGRIVAAAGRRRVRRAERLRLLLPFAASFVGSLAFAASPPVRERVREAFSFVRSGETARAASKPARSPKANPRTAAAASPPVMNAPAPPAPAIASPGAPVEAPLEASLPVVVAPARAARPLVPSAPVPVPAPEPAVAARPSSASFEVEPVAAKPLVPATGATAPNADLALYRRAHELHFGGADEARVLAAWDAYLREYPHGTFAPEARLNRAVCLAKLGRKAEAEGVLVDIERGRFGKDGRRQARKILGALDDGR